MQRLKNLARVLGLLVGLLAGAAQAQVQFIDLLWLKPGIKPEAAAHYFNELLPPILDKHGGKVVFIYEVESAMKGELKPAITVSMTFPSMDALQSTFKDPDYAKIIPVRDATFDFSQQSLFKVKPL